MFPTISNMFIYVAITFAIIFIIYSLSVSKKLPILTDIFSIMLAAAAGYTGIELCYFVLEGTKALGDYEDQKLVIILGGISVFWVSLTTVLNSVKGLHQTAE
ncbi:hypothetical protein [Cognaticolwellia mytili]|uniref:hypothetical protein n=1 Tax=Cognaticolwellia mytili TaxID=1888913 RepID=UPI000A16FF3B|nr:hypothetical protein [Cognaticolwellia mytili]